MVAILILTLNFHFTGIVLKSFLSVSISNLIVNFTLVNKTTQEKKSIMSFDMLNIVYFYARGWFQFVRAHCISHINKKAIVSYLTTWMFFLLRFWLRRIPLVINQSWIGERKRKKTTFHSIWLLLDRCVWTIVRNV